MDISIRGQVKGYDQRPIPNIKVTVYREEREMAHVFTDDAGRYSTSVPRGTPISVAFDTHYSLTNAKDWHPSVAANVNADNDLSLDRFLLHTGLSGGPTADIDALTAYQYLLVWSNSGDPDRKLSAEIAASRLSQMKGPTIELDQIRQSLAKYFRSV